MAVSLLLLVFKCSRGEFEDVKKVGVSASITEFDACVMKRKSDIK